LQKKEVMDKKELKKYRQYQLLLNFAKCITSYTSLSIGKKSKTVAKYKKGIILNELKTLKVGDVCCLTENSCLVGPENSIKIKITKIVPPPEEYPEKIMYIEYEKLKEI